jgi:hypothetical protein
LINHQDFYVYGHYRKDNDQLFYIGKGRQGRDISPSSRSQKWRSVVESAGGFYAKRLYANLPEDEALYLEAILLKNPEKEWGLVNKYQNSKPNFIDLNEINKYFYYDVSSPTCLSFKTRTGPKSGKTGDIAGYAATCDRYFKVRFKGKSFRVHRLIWVLHYGNISDNLVVNHIDNNSFNNKIENLQLIPQAHNARRTKRHKQENCGVEEVLKVDRLYAVAAWRSLEGKRCTKLFPHSKYGKEEAFRLATEARKQALIELNNQDAGYLIKD